MDGGRDPLWAAAVRARPVTAALIRQLAGYATHLARLTARLLPPARDRAIPLATRHALEEARTWLTLTAATHAQPGPGLTRPLPHSIPANLPPPRQPPADQNAATAERCAAAATAAARLRHLAVRADQPPTPSPSAAACWRHNALAAAIIGHNSELLLRTRAVRGHQLALAQEHQQAPQQSADARSPRARLEPTMRDSRYCHLA